MNRKRTVVLSSILAASLLGALGCSGSTASTDPTSSATAAQTGTRVAPVAANAKSSHIRMIAGMLSSVPLRDDQRAEIEKIASDADARHAATATAHADIMTALAAQVEAGKIDRAALQPKIDAAADAANAARPLDQAAMQRLHALLTPEQRGQVADAMAEHHKGMREAMHGGEHAHGSHMDKWAADLKLTDAQRAQIMTVVAGLHAQHEHSEMGAKMEQMHEHGKAFLDSFRSETLALPAPEDAHVHANAMADHVFGIAQAVLPILTPEQRTLAAAKLREKAASGEAPMGE